MTTPTPDPNRDPHGCDCFETLASIYKDAVDRQIESIDRADAEGRGPRGILSELAAGRDPFAIDELPGDSS